MHPSDLGLLNGWLRNISDVYRMHFDELNAIADIETRGKRLVELNVTEQCLNVAKSASVQRAYLEGGFWTYMDGFMMLVQENLLTLI